MTKIHVFILNVLFVFNGLSQVTINMEERNGVYYIPCKVNDLSLKFIYDTGASDVTISITEALFMLKHGYLKEEDLGESKYYSIANGDVAEGTEITLRKIEIGGETIHNIRASIIHDMGAPLLFGQSALSKLGKLTFDYSDKTLTIGENNSNLESSMNITGEATSNNYSYDGTFNFITSLKTDIPFDIPLRMEPNLSSKVVYLCPKNVSIYVIDNSSERYYQVVVNGFKGYIENTWLKRKW